MTALARQLPMTEAQWQSRVIDYARLRGWRVAHFRPARTKEGYRTPMQGDPGFPDLVLARNGRVVFAELKTERGKVSEEQRAWLNELTPVLAHILSITVTVRVWRPSQWADVQKVLG